MSDTKKPGFFYHLFMLRSPRSGMMFGLAMMLLFLALFQHLIMPAMTSSVVFRRILPTVVIYLAGMLFCGIGLYGILKNVFKSKILNAILAILAVLIPPLGGLLLLLPLLKHKRFVPALFALAGTIVYSASSAKFIDPFTMIFWGTVLIIIALLGMEDENPSLKWFTLPLAITAIMQFHLIYQEAHLQVTTREQRHYLARLTGRPIEISNFWERDAKGFPLNSEPLKTMIATQPDIFFDFDKVSWKDVEKVQKENPAFVKAFEEFLRLPVSHAAHIRPENDLLASVEQPELMMFRRTARYAAMKIHASPQDRKNVTSANAALITLRKWVQTPFTISLLVSSSIEAIRLEALSKVIACGKYEKAEILELIGEPVDWHAALRAAYADEAIAFESVIKHISNAALGELTGPVTGKLSQFLPNGFRVHFLKDHHFALQNYITICSQEDSLSALKKIDAAKFDETEAKRNGYIVSSMLLPALEIMYIKTASCTDRRQMVLLAVEVMEYYKQHGKLPDDLKFLPEIPLAELDHQPFMFEKTEDGFRIYTRDDKGKKPKITAPNYTYQVKLQQNASNKDKN